MKTFSTIALLLFLSLFINSYQAQCSPFAFVGASSNPGEIEVNDFSTTGSGAAATYSHIEFYDSVSGSPVGGFALQPATNTGLFQIPYIGTFGFYLIVEDSVSYCRDTMFGNIEINTLPNTQANCDAGFTSNVDSVNVNQYHFNLSGSNSAYATYAWDFGDGNSATSASPNNIYATSGTYSVCLTVTDTSNGGCTDTYCDNVLVGGASTSCTAVLVFDSTSTSLLPMQISFIDLSATTNSGNAIFTSVEFFDSAFTTSIGVVNLQPASMGGLFQFPNYGAYNYIFTLEDTIANCVDTLTGGLNVTNSTGNISASCDANFYQSIDSSNYQLYHFYSMGSGNSPTVAYAWDFGDGNTSTLSAPPHLYAVDGPYIVSLILSDTANGGCTDSFSYTVQVNPQTPSANSCTANFLLFEDSASSGFYFAWNFSTGVNMTYLWDFGDGNTSTQAYPSHTYASTGMYTICLTVNADSNCTDTFCDTLMAVVKSNGTTIQVLEPGQSVGVIEKDSFNDISIFPNPFGNEFTIQTESLKKQEIQISIYSIEGSLISKSLHNLEIGTNSIEMTQNDLTKGVYFIHISSLKTGERMVRKIVKY